MARSAKQLLRRMWRSTHGYSAQDVQTVLRGQGFKFRDRGKHTYYWHDEFVDLTISVPRHRELKPWVIREVVRLLETLSRYEQEEGPQ